MSGAPPGPTGARATGAPSGPTGARASGAPEGSAGSQDPRGRIPYYWGLLLSTLLLGVLGSLLTYLWMMQDLFPTVRVADRVRSPDAVVRTAPARASGAEPRVARVLGTAENARCASRAALDHGAQAEAWSGLARALGFSVEPVDDAGIPEPGGGTDVLVMPWSACLGDAQRARIEAYVEAGGGLLVAGPVREADLESGAAAFAGSPLARWLGARAATPVGEWRARFVVAARRVAPAAALEPGQRLELVPDRLAVAALLPQPALWWSDWALNPAEAPGGEFWAAAGAARLGAGRVVWFGFPVARGAAATPGALDGVRAHALAWASGDTLHAVAPWPAGHRHAAALVVDAEGSEQEVADAARRLSALGVPSTWFVFAEGVEASPPLLAALAGVGEVGSRGNLRAVLAGEPRASQRHRLRASRATLADATRRGIRGVHPPEERWDAITLKEAAAAGYGYLLGDPDFDRSFPRFVSVAGESLALLSRSGAGDDWVHLVDSPGGADAAAERFRADAARLRRLGGLHVLTLRTDLLVRHPGALGRTLEALREGDPWLTTADELVRWAEARRALRFEVEAASGQLRLRNAGALPASHVVVESYGDSPEPALAELAHLGPKQRIAVDEAVALAGRGR